MARQKLPRILNEWLEDTEQYRSAKEKSPSGTLSEAHLLAEAEWCLYKCTDEESAFFDEYHPASVAALRRYIGRLRAKGIRPAHDFDL